VTFNVNDDCSSIFFIILVYANWLELYLCLLCCVHVLLRVHTVGPCGDGAGQ